MLARARAGRQAAGATTKWRQYSFLWFIARIVFAHLRNVRESTAAKVAAAAAFRVYSDYGIRRVCVCSVYLSVTSPWRGYGHGHAFDMVHFVHSNENSFHRKFQMTSSSSLLCLAQVFVAVAVAAAVAVARLLFLLVFLRFFF